MADYDYSKYYQRIHQLSDEYYELMCREYRDLFHGLLPSDRTAKILDIGCGTGFAVNAIKKSGYLNVAGIDADAGQVEIAQNRNLPVQFVPANETPGYLDSLQSSLRMALLLEVLEHIPQDSQIGFLRSIRSALEPGGLLICQVPNALCQTATYIRYADWTHRCLFSVESLMFVLENAGFVVDAMRAGRGRPSPARRFLPGFVMPAARFCLQSLTNFSWRISVIANLGFPKGFQHPISPTLVAVARRC